MLETIKLIDFIVDGTLLMQVLKRGRCLYPEINFFLTSDHFHLYSAKFAIHLILLDQWATNMNTARVLFMILRRQVNIISMSKVIDRSLDSVYITNMIGTLVKIYSSGLSLCVIKKR